MNEEVLLKLPHRKFVFTIPKMLRPYFRYNQNLFAYYNAVSGKALQSALAISYQTYGDVLRFNPHWHCIVMEGALDEEGNFYYLPIKDTSKLCELFRRKVIKLLFKQGLMDEKRARILI